MRRFYLFLIFILMCGVAIAGSPSQTIVDDTGKAVGTSSNPLYVNFGSGPVSVPSIVTTGTDERIYGNTYNTNFLGFKDSAIYTHTNALMVDGMVYTLGNVGFGTTELSAGRLSVQGAASTNPVKVYTADGSNLFEVGLGSSKDGSIGVYNNTTRTVYLNANGDSYLNRSTGNVGIATVTPVTKLQVGSGTPRSQQTYVDGGIYAKGTLQVEGVIYGGASVTTGYATCWTTGALQLGHCITTPTNGACTCANN